MVNSFELPWKNKVKGGLDDGECIQKYNDLKGICNIDQTIEYGTTFYIVTNKNSDFVHGYNEKWDMCCEECNPTQRFRLR